MLTRRRLRQRMETLDVSARLTGTDRIARDIHDDVGASLTRITMLSDRCGAIPLRLSPTRGAGLSHTRAKPPVPSMRSYGRCNPKYDTLDSLANYLGRYAQSFRNAAHVRAVSTFRYICPLGVNGGDPAIMFFWPSRKR